MIDDIINTLPDQVVFDTRNLLIGSEEEYTNNISRYIPDIERTKKEVRFGSYLDIGCGRGEMLEIFKRYAKPKKYWGIDENRLCIDICKKKRLPVMWMDPIERLNYVKSNYKIITCIQFLQYLHVGYIYTLLDLVRWRLKRGGIIIIQIPNPDNPSEVSRWKNDPRFINAYSPNLIEYFMRYIGFFSVEIQPHDDGKNVTIIGMRKPYPKPI